MDALRRISALKKGLTVAAVLGFGAFGGLAARHNVGAAGQAPATTPANAQTPPGPAAQNSPAQPPDQAQQNQSPDDSQQDQQYQPPDQSQQQGGFFGQGQGGYGFGNSGSAQVPVAASGAS